MDPRQVGLGDINCVPHGTHLTFRRMSGPPADVGLRFHPRFRLRDCELNRVGFIVFIFDPRDLMKHQPFFDDSQIAQIPVSSLVKLRCMTELTSLLISSLSALESLPRVLAPQGVLQALNRFDPSATMAYVVLLVTVTQAEHPDQLAIVADLPLPLLAAVRAKVRDSTRKAWSEIRQEIVPFESALRTKHAA